ncbi:MAG: transglutaminase [Verrucomicrobia bacterium]|nr:MAG: transglutaminase [Verrucomicrobiota bacterium]
MYRIVATALWVVLQIMKLLRETGHRPVATAPPLWKSRSAPLLIIPICFLLSAVASHAAGDIGIIKGADQFEFVYRVKLPEITGEACVWIPLAKTDSFQTVTVEELNVPMKWEKAHDREYGNDICVLHPQPEDSGKTIEVRYRVVRKEKASYPANNAEAARYLRPEKLVPIDETFRTLAEKAAAGKTDDLDRAKALYDHVMGRMRYDKSGTGWGRGDAKYACDVRTGNCTDFHSYFIALARSIGIPARFAIGATIPADRNEGTIEGYHCWAEFLADGRWVPVDISEAWKNPKLADYYFGHNPANRFELTKGRDLVVDPEPESGPINFLAYPLLEMNGEVVKPETTFMFRRIGA